MNRTRSIPALVALAAVAGCASTHPRYSPELGRRWPDCMRLVVIPGTVKVEEKNYLTDDYFVDEAKGKSFSQLLADSSGRYLREEAGREVRHSGEAIQALGGDVERVHAVADVMLEHARRWMSRDPGYANNMLHGLPPDPGVVPFDLRRGFDAVVVVGGHAKFETEHETIHRYVEILVRNIVALPLIYIAPIVPGAFALAIGIVTPGAGYWQSAPNCGYFQVAVFDAHTGRLLYTNDWFLTSPIIERNDFDGVAADLLEDLAKVKLADQPPLGAPPER